MKLTQSLFMSSVYPYLITVYSEASVTTCVNHSPNLIPVGIYHQDGTSKDASAFDS